MALLLKILPLLLVSVLAATQGHARPRRGKPAKLRVPPFTVVIPLQLPPIWPAITSPISPELRKQLEKEQAPRPLLPRLENLPLPNGLTMMLDRSLTVRLDLATLWQKRVQQPDTYSLTLEAQSGSGWLWLTYRMPGTTAVPAPLSPLPREARLEK